MRYPPIEIMPNNPSLEGLARMVPDVTYSTASGCELKLSVLEPWIHKEEPGKHHRPLIVFVQGSAWQFPDMYKQIPQLSAFAQAGYVAATVTHRNAMEGHPFPAYLQDVKTAIRFLRAHADEYGIDPARVAIWGTSSGGNTALLVGVTGDDPAYKTEEYADMSDAVQAVVDCFGPSDIPALFEDFIQKYPEVDIHSPDNIFYGLCGGPIEEHMDVRDKMSPVRYVSAEKKLPPFLLLQGDADPVVPLDQCLRMYHTLCDAGAEAHMIQITNAPHEGSFWSRALLEKIKDFLDNSVGK